MYRRFNDGVYGPMAYSQILNTLSGEILAQLAQNENFVRKSKKNTRQKYQKA